MNEWIKYKISTLIESKALVIGDGYRAKNSELSSSEGLPFARAGDVNDGFHLENAECLAPENLHKAGEKIAQAGDVLFTSKGTVGRIAFVTDRTPEFVYSPQLTWWRVLDQKQINPDFLYCWMRGREFVSQLNSFSGQTDMAAYVSLKDQRQMMYITLPEIEEQKEIAAAISCLDRKIENLRKQNETLEAIAQTLFKHWFIDFEFPNADGKPYKSSGGAMEPSELGEIPAGWRVVRMEEIADRIAMGPFGSRITTDNFVDSGVPVIRGGNLVNGFNERDFVYLTEEKADDLKSSNAFPEDIVFTHRGTLGQVGFIPTNSTYPRYVVSQSQMLLGVNKALASSRLIYRFFCSKVGLNAILANKNTTGVPSIGRPTTTLKSIQIALPENGIMNQFDSLIKATDSKIEANDLQILTLTKTRDTLLPKLMSGQLRITE